MKWSGAQKKVVNFIHSEVVERLSDRARVDQKLVSEYGNEH